MNFIFPFSGNFIIPTDELIFFRGVGLNHQPDRVPPWAPFRVYSRTAPGHWTLVYHCWLDVPLYLRYINDTHYYRFLYKKHYIVSQIPIVFPYAC